MLIRLLNAVLILLRWPAALFAALVIATTVASGWFIAGGRFVSATNGDDVAVILSGGTLGVHWGDVRGVYNSGSLVNGDSFGCRWANGWGNWTWAPHIDLGRNMLSPFETATIPLWLVAVAATALAAMGFRAESRRPTPGFCKRCRYPLHSELKCPECGRPAPTPSRRTVGT